jgi:hypothetical protein
MKSILNPIIYFALHFSFINENLAQFAVSPIFKFSFSKSLLNSSGTNKTFEYKLILGLNSYVKFSEYFYYSPDISIILSKGNIGNDAYCKCKNHLALDINASLVSATITSPSKFKFENVSLHKLLPSNSENFLFNNKYLIQLSSSLIAHVQKGYNFNQTLGQIQIRLNNLQLGYYNDATPFNKICFGDGYDRYFTGGGYLKINIDSKEPYNFQFGYEFEKFTGYQQNAFELNNILAFEYIIMSDIIELKKNSNISRLYVTTTKSENFNFNLNIIYSFRDYKNDIQDFIHKYISSNPIFRTHSYSSQQLGLSFSNINLYKWPN